MHAIPERSNDPCMLQIYPIRRNFLNSADDMLFVCNCIDILLIMIIIITCISIIIYNYNNYRKMSY